MKRTITVLAILLCNSALASQPQPEEVEFQSNVVSIGPQTVTVVSDGTTKVTVGEARVGSKGPEVESTNIVGRTKPVEARGLFGEAMAGSTGPKRDSLQAGNTKPVEARGLFGEQDSQKKGPQNVTAVGLKDVDLTGVSKVTINGPVQASLYSFKFGQSAASMPAESSSTLTQAEGTIHVKPRVERTANSVTAVGYDSKVHGPLPAGTKEVVVDGPVQVFGAKFVFGPKPDNNDE
jgi:hypothetical protein